MFWGSSVMTGLVKMRRACLERAVFRLDGSSVDQCRSSNERDGGDARPAASGAGSLMFHDEIGK